MTVRQVQQHRVAGGPFAQGPYRGLVQLTGDQVTFPMPGDGTVLYAGRPVADHHHGVDEPLIPLAFSPLRFASRASSPTCLLHITFQPSTSLEVQGLVDRLVTHPHAPVTGMIPT